MSIARLGTHLMNRCIVLCTLLLLSISLLFAKEKQPLFPYLTQTFQSSFGTVAYYNIGTSQDTVLLCIHGLPTSKEIFIDLFQALPTHYRLIAMDLNNYGQSEKTKQKMTHKERAAVIDELRQHLNLESFILVSHDLGSSVAIDYMGSYGERVEKFIVMSAPVYPDFEPPSIVKLIRKPKLGRRLLRMFPRTIFKIAMKKGLAHNRSFTPEVYEVYKEAYASGKDYEALYDNLNWGFPHDYYKEYPQIMRNITVPTLIIHGKKDPYIPYRDAKRMHADIPNSKLILLEDASHFIPMDASQDIAKEITHFLSEHDALTVPE